MFEERHKKRGGIKTQQVQDTSAAGKSKNAKGEELSKAAEEDITDQLFASEIQQDSASLKTQKDYESFANQVGDVLFEGQAPYHIPAFFTELAKGLSKSQTKTEEVKLIIDRITVVYNAKVAEDKKRDGGNKKGSKKAKLNAGKAAAETHARNNNPQMVSDLMGDEDDYGDEYGEEKSGRQAEADYDFM
jgi:hypothetical protein